MSDEYALNDTIRFGEFMGMTVKEAADRNPRLLFRMQNGTEFHLDEEALDYVKSQLI